MYKIDTQNKIIEANCGIFIIPNHACKVEGYMEFYQHELRKRMKKLCAVNDTEFNDCHIVECWIHSKEDFDCDNMCDHPFTVEIDGTEYYVEGIRRDFPEVLMRGHKEGDIVDIRYPVYLCERRFKDNEDGLQYTLLMHLEFNQRSYRYRNFGNIEDVLEKVVY